MVALHARSEGDSGDWIVLVHGFGGSHAAWHDVQERLSHSFRTIAYDMPGHGASLAWPGAGHAKVAARAILGDLAARGVDSCHVAGHSMGGAVAALMALLEPARVASLTLCAPGGFGPQINHRLLARFAAAVDDAGLRACLDQMFGWYGSASDETVAEIRRQRAVPGQTEMLVGICEGMTRDGRQGQIPRSELARIGVPATVVWGRLDNVLPAFHAEGLADNYRVVLIDDAGHMLPEEESDTVAALIAETVQRASGKMAPD